jgi:hypothetical protein
MSVFETEWESYETPEMGEFGEVGESEGEGEYESESEYESGEYENQEQFLPIGGILSSLLGGELEGPLHEQQEAELASELLEISNEQELEQFLGKLISGAAPAVGGFVKSPVGKALGGVLKNVAKTALPVVGGALGSFVAPGVGTAIGSKLGSMASNLFELELEGMNEQEAEFEVARRYVRFASSAAARAARSPQNVAPRVVVRRAVVGAARRHAPGLVRPGAMTQARRRPQPRRRPTYTTGRPYYRSGDSYGGYPTQTYNVSGYGEPATGDSGGWGSGQTYGQGSGQTYGQVSARPKSGRWMRRGSKIVLFGV